MPHAFESADRLRRALNLPDEASLPAALRDSLHDVLESPAPMQVWWGGGLVVFENTASLRARGGAPQQPRPPEPARQLYENAWSTIEPVVGTLMRDGRSAVLHEVPLTLVSPTRRLSRTATLLLQPIYDAEAGAVAGVISTIVAEPDPDADAEPIARQASQQNSNQWTEALGDLTECLEALPHSFVMLDQGFRVTFLNGRARDLLGLDAASAHGRPAFDVFPRTESRDFEQLLESTMRERTSGSVTAFHPESERWHEVWCAPASSGLMVYLRDVSAEKATDAALRLSASDRDAQQRIYEAILTNTPDLAYVFDLNHRFIYANDILLRMWGRTREEAIGRNCLELGYEPWHAAMHDREIDEVAATGATVRGEVPFHGTFGRRMYEYILVPVFGDEGQVIAVAGTTRDVTDSKEREEELRLLAARLSESDRRKNEFLAMLAHELRNPLSPILNGIQIIQQSDGDRASRISAAGMMERQVRHMVRLVNDLLDISRISRGTIELRCEPVPLVRVMALVEEAVEPTLRSAGQRLNVARIDPSVVVDGDVVRLVQAFTNLVGNASKFSATDADIDVVVTASDVDVTVAVRDYGAGIPTDMLSGIFEMFTQLETTRNRDHGGLGIGLTLVRSLIESHGGSVRATSDGPGAGSEFVVTLPRIPEPRSSVAELSFVPVGSSGRRILVVDDNRDSARSLSILLSLSGHDTTTAFDGAEALEVARHFQPDIVLLDIGLPRLNGYEVCRALRSTQAERRLVIVALTGWGQAEDRQKAVDAGFDAHLVKPVDPETLHRTLRDLTW